MGFTGAGTGVTETTDVVQLYHVLDETGAGCGTEELTGAGWLEETTTAEDHADQVCEELTGAGLLEVVVGFAEDEEETGAGEDQALHD